MDRRQFLELSGAAGGALLLGSSAVAEATPAVATTNHPKPVGAVTYYTEIRVPPPEKAAVLAKMDELIALMQGMAGYLSLSFKQTIGESTMGRAYPNPKKAILAEALAKLDGTLSSPKVPYFYVMFLRFDSYDNLLAAGVQAWFKANIVPSLFAYNAATTPPTKTTIALDFHEGVYTTVAAADRINGYMTAEEISTYLASKQSDEVAGQYVSVNNHYMIMDANRKAHYNLLRENLNGNTRSIFRPIQGDEGYDDSNPDYVANGQPAAPDNVFFRKAMTREILQNAFPEGEKRN